MPPRRRRFEAVRAGRCGQVFSWFSGVHQELIRRAVCMLDIGRDLGQRECVIHQAARDLCGPWSWLIRLYRALKTGSACGLFTAAEDSASPSRIVRPYPQKGPTFDGYGSLRKAPMAQR
jgi:hypothetical protein